MEMVVREKRGVKPLLLKLGIALALSFAGFLVLRLRPRHRHRLPPPTSASDDSDAGAKATTSTAGSSGGLKDELLILKSEEGLAKLISGTTTKTTTTTTTTTLVGLSPNSKSSGDEEGFLLPEFNDLVLKEFESTGKEPETTPNTPIYKKAETREESAMEQEIADLWNLVWSLREREQSLELQLLEYYGMQEQDAAVRELESQLKINTVEAKLYTLKIESMQSDNQRLQAQVSDFSRVTAELEAARAKIKLLKKKIKFDGEQAKEKIVALHQRISMMQERGHGDGGDSTSTEVERGLKRLKELEEEAAILRKVNSELTLQKSDLILKLESTQKLASSVLEGSKGEALEQADQLRQLNDKLTKEIEQLKTDRCADVEELVYLRWVNACLRYELRNYQPPPGRTVARDLSKNLSPKSEEKAKHLILEYANTGGDKKNLGVIDFELEYSSSSQTSTGESDDTSFDVPSMTKHSNTSKSKFLSKLKKLVLGKESHSNKISSAERTPTSCGNSQRILSISGCFDDVIGRDSYDSFSSCMTEEHAPTNQLEGIEGHAYERRRSNDIQSQSFSRPSLDIQRLRRLHLEEEKSGKGEQLKNDAGSSCVYKRIISSKDDLIGLNQNNAFHHEDNDVPEKIELKRFANILKSSRGMGKLTRRSASFSD